MHRFAYAFAAVTLAWFAGCGGKVTGGAGQGGQSSSPSGGANAFGGVNSFAGTNPSAGTHSGGGANSPSGGAPVGTLGGSGSGGTTGPADGGEVPGGAGGSESDIPADLKRDILDTSLSLDLQRFTGVALITLAPSASTSASFEIGDLKIGSVTLQGAPLRFNAQNGRLDVEVMPSGTPLVLSIKYGFRLHENAGASAAGYTLIWPYYCGNLFPCHSDPADGTTFHLTLLGLSNGATTIYPSYVPADAPSYMIAWSAGTYRELTLGNTGAGTLVSIWHPPAAEATAKKGGAHLLQAFDWYEKALGPYRFGGRVGSVAVAWQSGQYGGMEHHPYWHVALDSLGDELTHVHEAAHGWFGNGVRLRCWEDFVLSEGTVSYLAARALEQVGGAALSDPVWKKYEADLDARRTGPNNHVAWPQSCGQVDVLAGLFARSTYVKGAFFYRAVEGRVGRASLDAALAKFYALYAGKAAGMRDMLAVIEQVTGYDPTSCARDWLIQLEPVPKVGPCQ